MKENAIVINDLHSHALLKLPEIQKSIGNVHFSPYGYQYLARKVTQSINKQLYNVINNVKL